MENPESLDTKFLLNVPPQITLKYGIWLQKKMNSNQMPICLFVHLNICIFEDDPKYQR